MEEIDYSFGDCRKLIKSVPNNTVKMIVTSPPYNIKKVANMLISLRFSSLSIIYHSRNSL